MRYMLMLRSYESHIKKDVNASAPLVSVPPVARDNISETKATPCTLMFL